MTLGFSEARTWSHGTGVRDVVQDQLSQRVDESGAVVETLHRFELTDAPESRLPACLDIDLHQRFQVIGNERDWHYQDRAGIRSSQPSQSVSQAWPEPLPRTNPALVAERVP